MREKGESKYVRFARLWYMVAQVAVSRYAHPKARNASRSRNWWCVRC